MPTNLIWLIISNLLGPESRGGQRACPEKSTGSKDAIVVITIVLMNTVRLDAYVLDTLMADLVGHDRAPSAFLVYLALWSRAGIRRGATAKLSHRDLAEETGLSKSAVQDAVRRLIRRRLVSLSRASA